MILLTRYYWIQLSDTPRSANGAPPGPWLTGSGALVDGLVLAPQVCLPLKPLLFVFARDALIQVFAPSVLQAASPATLLKSTVTENVNAAASLCLAAPTKPADPIPESPARAPE